MYVKLGSDFKGIFLTRLLFFKLNRASLLEERRVNNGGLMRRANSETRQAISKRSSLYTFSNSQQQYSPSTASDNDDNIVSAPDQM